MEERTMLKIENLNQEFMTFGPVSFDVKTKEIVGIIGESGTGKSILLKSIADMLPHDGKIFLDEVEQQDIKAREWRKQVALLPAEVVFWNHKIKDDLKTADHEVIKKFGFNPLEILEKNTDDLSSGEKQRIGLLRIFENRPKVLLLDEPSANLDEKNKMILEEIVLDYIETNNASAVWVAHDPEQLKRVSSKIYQITQNSFREII
ncbi:MAG: ATP-binding cassette domain-containing protein [Desulfobacteraceae bacterium]|nr:ATP-binding cassette domain-containing protein [Desulfobacteraceae bacterium]